MFTYNGGSPAAGKASVHYWCHVVRTATVPPALCHSQTPGTASPPAFSPHSLDKCPVSEKERDFIMILHFYLAETCWIWLVSCMPSFSTLFSRSQRCTSWWWRGCRLDCCRTPARNPVRTAEGDPGVSCGHTEWPKSPNSVCDKPGNTAERKSDFIMVYYKTQEQTLLDAAKLTSPPHTPLPGNKRSCHIPCIWTGSAVYAVCASERLSTTRRSEMAQWAPQSQAQCHLYLQNVERAVRN